MRVPPRPTVPCPATSSCGNDAAQASRYRYGMAGQPDAVTQVRLLGPPRITRGGAVVAVDTRKAIALLAYLAVTGRAASRDHLASLLWPDADQQRARSALRRTLSALNTALGGSGLDIARETLATTDGVEIDVTTFRNAAAADDVASLRRAADLVEGDLLAGFTLRDSPEFDDWQLAAADELREQLGAVLDTLSARVDGTDALAFAKRWVSLNDLHEPAHRRVMELYARNGDRASALKQYRECVAALERGLGVEPLDDTTELYESIRQDRGALTSPRPVMPVSVASVRELPLVGRTHEIATLSDAYASIARSGRLIVIGGEPGIGKTRLAGELVASARTNGAVVIETRCHPEEERMAFGTIVELLRSIGAERITRCAPSSVAEIARLAPDLAGDVATSSAIDPAAAQTRLFQAIVDVITTATSSDAPALVFIDDAHWMDESSVDVLRYLVRRLTDHPLCVLIAWRTDDVPPAHPLRRMLADAIRDGVATGVTVERLTSHDVDELARVADATEEVRTTLFEQTAGVPLFVVEYLTQPTSPDGLPSGVRDLLSSRVTRVGAMAGQVLAAASVIGRTFDPATLRAASGRSEDEVVAALEELVTDGLLSESNDAYDFSHPRLRDYVYETTTLGRRRLLHARVAKVFGRAMRRHPELSSLAAQHSERAGRSDEAAAQYRAAGDHARGLYANAEALSHYNAALALGADDTALLHEAIGDLFTLDGRYGDAIASYEKAVALGASPGEIARKLGDVRHRLGEWEAADAHLVEALEALPPGRDRALAGAQRALNAHRAGAHSEAAAFARAASDEAVASGDLTAQAQAANVAGIIALRGEDADGARAHLERSLSLAERTGDDAAQAAALNNLALAKRREGDLAGALADGERALEICRRTGDRHREAALHSNLGDVLHELGRTDESIEHVKASVAILADIGATGEPQPEIWKLVEW